MSLPRLHHHQFLTLAIWRRWVRMNELNCPRPLSSPLLSSMSVIAQLKSYPACWSIGPQKIRQEQNRMIAELFARSLHQHGVPASGMSQARHRTLPSTQPWIAYFYIPRHTRVLQKSADSVTFNLYM